MGVSFIILTLYIGQPGNADRWQSIAADNQPKLEQRAVQIAPAELQFELANTVFVTISNDHLAATEAWKILKAESVPNIYILEGGINAWLDTYGGDSIAAEDKVSNRQADQLAYRFNAAAGSRHPAAEPVEGFLDLKYEPKVILDLKRAPTSGGCG